VCGPFTGTIGFLLTSWTALDGWYGWGALKDSSQPG
jgi:hypothetical protein